MSLRPLSEIVMAGFMPAIHVLLRHNKKVVDSRDKPGHDEKMRDLASHFFLRPGRSVTPYFKSSGAISLGRNSAMSGQMHSAISTRIIGTSMIIVSFNAYRSRTFAIAHEIIRHNP